MTPSSSASVLSDQSIYSKMDHSHLHAGPEYTINNMVDYGMDHYLTEGTSTNSSPSPVMFNTSTQLRTTSPLPLQMYDQYIPQPELVTFDAFPEHPPGYEFYDMAQPVPIVEFTDLTAPYPQEDRRRRRSQIRDKQELSSMHMRRRAQNRASQRAFRERKEKHAQSLQSQLDELETKHKDLQTNYDRLDSTNQKLTSELDTLRQKLAAMRSWPDEEVASLLDAKALDEFKDDLQSSRKGVKASS